MKIVNLTPGFNPWKPLEVEYSVVEYEHFIFPGGEHHIKLPKMNKTEKYYITTRLNNADDILKLQMMRSALDTIGAKEVHLFAPYFPGARQDRMVTGEPQTLRMMAGLINSLGFKRVAVYDPHSEMTAGFVHKIDVRSNHTFIERVIEDITRITPTSPADYNMWGKDFGLVSPDAGSNKKMYDLCKAVDAKDFIRCDKHRDMKTGKLTGFQVYADDLKGLDCLIVDDICDGGGTFIGVAKELKKKNAGKLYLAVSHGIFSKGLEELEKYFTCIYTTDSIFTAEDTYAPNFLEKNTLKQFKLNKL